MKRIFIIDDSKEMLTLYRYILEREGYEVWTAANGQAGLNLLKEHGPPDLLLLDSAMPGMNGKEFLLQALENGDLQENSTRVVLFSGFTKDAAPIHETRHLVHDFLEKPRELDQFISEVRRLLPFHEDAGTVK